MRQTEDMHLIPPAGHTRCLALERMSSFNNESNAQSESREAEEQGVIVTNNVRTDQALCLGTLPWPQTASFALGINVQ